VAATETTAPPVMTDEAAYWVWEHVIVSVPGIMAPYVAGGRCACQGARRSCCCCWGGFHDLCHKTLSYREGDLFGHGFTWPPLAPLWLADRLCHRPCACPTCYPPAEQLDLFGDAA
jgi:hypothetical protein